jgi:hypothetical protein
VQPPFSEAVKKAVYEEEFFKCGMTLLDVTKNAIQFDHTQPRIVLVRYHLFNVDYTVLDLLTGYREHRESVRPRAQDLTIENIVSSGRKIYSPQYSVPFPVLEHKSLCRLRLLGDNIKTKTVKVILTPEQPTAHYIRDPARALLQLQSSRPDIFRIVRSAKLFCQRLEAGKKKKCTLEEGHSLLKRFLKKFEGKSGKKLNPYFFVWYSDGALTKLHGWVQQQKNVQNITKL